MGIKNVEKRMSYWLRHKPDEIGIELDSNGWVDFEIFLKKSQISKDIVEKIVKSSSKQRFSIKNGKIRANQGHSITINIEFKEIIPPDTLYHGTNLEKVSIILGEGLKSMSRHHVHLSKDIITARQVGNRYGESKVLLINANQMVLDGKKFWISDNGVYLTEFVESKYITGVQ